MEVRSPAKTACFGPFKLDLKAGELRKDTRKIRLQEQPFQILKMLLEHPGEVVSREEIRQKLWPNDSRWTPIPDGKAGREKASAHHRNDACSELVRGAQAPRAHQQVR
jgi:hypothetical protein